MSVIKVLPGPLGREALIDIPAQKKQCDVHAQGHGTRQEEGQVLALVGVRGWEERALRGGTWRSALKDSRGDSSVGREGRAFQENNTAF